MGVSKIKAHSIGCGAVGCCRRPGREHVGQEVVRALRNELARAGVCRHSAQAGLRPAGDRASLAAHGCHGRGLVRACWESLGSGSVGRCLHGHRQRRIEPWVTQGSPKCRTLYALVEVLLVASTLIVTARFQLPYRHQPPTLVAAGRTSSSASSLVGPRTSARRIVTDLFRSFH